MRNYTFLLVLAATLLSGRLGAQVPKLVNYQGHVAVDAKSFEGAGQFKFALVNSNGTITFWSNDGTSAGGGEPAAAVTLPVAKGLYSVLLGDTALGNMTAIPASVFINPDVRLRVWFNDGVKGSQLLTPDQRLAPAAYLADGTVTSASVGAAAITSGKIAPGAVDGTNIAPASLTSGNFAVPGPPVNGQVLGYNNGGLTWTAPGGGVFSLNGTSAYYNGGNVGIGTTAPAAKFEVNGLLRSTRVGVAIQYIQLNGGDPNSINLTAQSAVAAEKNLVIENLSGESTPGANNNIQFVLGTAAARSTKMTLTKDGNISLPLGGSGGGIQIGTPNFETGLSIVGTNRADIRFDGLTLKLLASAGTGIPPNTNGITINTSGNVGIGTTAPVAKLHAETTQANTAAIYAKSATGPAVRAEGDATQARDKGGFVKAMAFIDPFLPANQYVVRCYNSQQAGGAVSTPPCGITVTRLSEGWYKIDFGFYVQDRFLNVTPDRSATTAAHIDSFDNNVYVSIVDPAGHFLESQFFITLY